MSKRLLCLSLLLSLLLTGCGQPVQPQQKLYEASFLDVFDTVTTLKGPGESQEAFTQTAEQIKNELLHYHRLFDIYNDYEGINNLKTINDCAGGDPVVVDPAIIELLTDCIAWHDATDGRVNVAMGSVLHLWHTARNAGIDDPQNAYLPDPAELAEAAKHTDIRAIVIDRTASTVRITDPQVRLDVGAIAKGWAAQRVRELAPQGFLISVGGNVCATGPKDSLGTPWVVGIQNPDGGSDFLHTLNVSSGSVVTSGDYQRGYVVDWNYYHHIIDPDTLYPGTLWRSVTIVCQDSGLADALSTALFLLPQAEGQAILDQYQAEAMWVDADGVRYYSAGFENLIRN